MPTLLVREQRSLARCEEKIEKGMATFVEVGKALAEIRDRKLYRDTHKTFAAYVKERWGKSRNWADVTIQSSAAVASIENAHHGGQKPNERQARELAKAPEEDRAEVWEEVTEEHGEKITAAKVAAAVERLTAAENAPVEEPPEPKPEPKPEPRVKNGKPVVSVSQRKEIKSLFGKLVRMMSQAGVYERNMVLLNQLSEALDGV